MDLGRKIKKGVETAPEKEVEALPPPLRVEEPASTPREPVPA